MPSRPSLCPQCLVPSFVTIFVCRVWEKQKQFALGLHRWTQTECHGNISTNIVRLFLKQSCRFWFFNTMIMKKKPTPLDLPSSKQRPTKKKVPSLKTKKITNETNPSSFRECNINTPPPNTQHCFETHRNKPPIAWEGGNGTTSCIRDLVFGEV